MISLTSSPAILPLLALSRDREERRLERGANHRHAGPRARHRHRRVREQAAHGVSGGGAGGVPRTRTGPLGSGPAGPDPPGAGGVECAGRCAEAAGRRRAARARPRRAHRPLRQPALRRHWWSCGMARSSRWRSAHTPTPGTSPTGPATRSCSCSTTPTTRPGCSHSTSPGPWRLQEINGSKVPGTPITTNYGHFGRSQ